MKNKQEKGNNLTMILSIACVLLFIVAVAMSVVNVGYKTELSKVPCWNEQCLDKEVTDNEYSVDVSKVYKYKTEKVATGKMTLKDSNILPIHTIKGIIDPLANKLIEEDSFGTTVEYIEMGMYDSDGSEIYTAKKGTKPVWLVE